MSYAGTALDRARAYADASYASTLSVTDLAERACLSRAYFIRAFRRRFHETPHQYIIRRRVERAKELLACTEAPITGICLDVGFESLGSFSALFHRAVGWSPSIYRARSWAQRSNPRAHIPACCWRQFGFDAVTRVS